MRACHILLVNDSVQWRKIYKRLTFYKESPASQAVRKVAVEEKEVVGTSRRDKARVN